MEPFTLKKYLKEPDRKVFNDKGENVRVIYTDPEIERCPIVAITKNDDGKESHVSIFPSKENSTYGLSFAPTKKIGWVNLFRDSIGKELVIASVVYETKDEALSRANDGVTCKYLTTCKIEWEE